MQRPDAEVELEPTILMKPGQRPRPAAPDPTIVIPRASQPSAPPEARTNVRATPPQRPGVDPFAVPGRVPEKTRAVSVDPDAFFGPTDRSGALGAEETILIPPRRPARDVPAKPPTRDVSERSKSTTPSTKKPARPAAAGPWARLTSAVASWKTRASPPPGRRPQGSGRVEQSWWKQYGLSIAVAAGLLIAVGVVALAVLWLAGPSPGYVLTVTRPLGGTISGAGLIAAQADRIAR